MGISDEIERLERMRNNGTLSEMEFQQAKTRVLNEAPAYGGSTSRTSSGGLNSEVNEDSVYGIETNTWCMLMHLSQLLIVAFGTGFVIPIVMWAISKDHNRQADEHGVAILNWMLSLFIYLTLFGLLSFVLVGIPFLVVYAVLSLLFPIMGAIKATNGEEWRYPTAIRFIKTADEVEYDHRQEYL